MILKKFNVIIPINQNSTDSIIKNYLENYFESEINIYHPEYINQILKNNKIEITIDKTPIDNFIIQKKQFIKQLIKKDELELFILNNIINKIINKKKYIIKLFGSNINFNCIINILSEPLVINFLENEIKNLEKDTIEEVKKLYSYILNEYNNEINEHVLWFIKLVGNSLYNYYQENIDIITLIPNGYKLLYEINYGISHINEIKIKYKFINNKELLVLTETSLRKKIIEYIETANIIELYEFFKYKIKFIKLLFKGSYNIINEKIIINLNAHTYYKINDILNIITILTQNNLFVNGIIELIDKKELIDSLCGIINNNIENKKYIASIIKSIKTIKNKDIFFDLYHKSLIFRIFSNSINVENEFYILKSLEHSFGIKSANKIYKVINDYYVSEKNFNFYKTISGVNNYHIITTSYSSWDINYSQGYFQNIESNDLELNSIIENYTSYYKKIYDNKRDILWLLHYGEIEVEYNNQTIKLLPIQLLLLEHVDFHKKVKHEELFNSNYLINYSNKFKNQIISSLLMGNIIVKTDGYYKLSNKNINSNLIKIYLSLGNESIFVDTTKELAYAREEIIKSNINHLLKKSPLTKNILYNKCSNMITLFSCNNELFDQVITKMIEQDYIINIDNKYVKCVY